MYYLRCSYLFSFCVLFLFFGVIVPMEIFIFMVVMHICFMCQTLLNYLPSNVGKCETHMQWSRNIKHKVEKQAVLEKVEKQFYFY